MLLSSDISTHFSYEARYKELLQLQPLIDNKNATNERLGKKEKATEKIVKQPRIKREESKVKVEKDDRRKGRKYEK